MQALLRVCPNNAINWQLNWSSGSYRMYTIDQAKRAFLRGNLKIGAVLFSLLSWSFYLKLLHGLMNIAGPAGPPDYACASGRRRSARPAAPGARSPDVGHKARGPQGW